MQKTVKKAGNRKRKPLSPVQIQRREQTAHKKSYLALFQKLGFAHLDSDGIQLTYEGRQGEFDGIFIFQNILLIVEYTIGKPDSAHLLRKKVLYDLILNDVEKFLAFAEITFPGLKKEMNALYPRSAYRINILYASKHDPSDEVMNVCPRVNFIHGATFKYFQALANTIEKSARIEFLKFLGLNYDDVGDGAIGSSRSPLTYEGFLLPAGNSSYPTDYKVVSFYADPERLIARSYVLRRDGWRDESHLYQRILIPKKIRQMRRYLVEEKRVFVNNIIVTLPAGTQLNVAGSNGLNLQGTDAARVKAVSVQIPDGFDTIGLVDGQHRVFCYHEGSDRAEDEIKILRKRQNLMVTGIVYPAKVSEIDRRSFEAKLFLEINDNQARARSSLKQDIEVIIRPNSGTAIAKRVIQELGRRGPYRGLLQANYFDLPIKIKTASIVSYGLRPLVKLDGKDSLFAAWSHPDKEKLRELKGSDQTALREEYIKFCTDKINEFFVAVKLAYGDQDWDIESKSRSPLLSLTAINGLIMCLRKIIDDGQVLNSTAHKKKLKDIDKVDFSSFKSSQWQKLGALLFSNHYGS